MPPPRIRPSRPLTSLYASTTPLRTSITPSTISHTQRRTIRSIQKPAPTTNRFAPGNLNASPQAAHARRLAADVLPLRPGALATKKGMTAVFDPLTGERTPCTVLQLDRVQVVAHKTMATHGYYAVVVGSGWRHPDNVGKPMMGVFANTRYSDPNGGERGLPPKRFLREFMVKDEKALLPVGRELSPKWFLEGQWVDVQGTTRGMGFAGGMKRWGFTGQPASHGVSLTHRSMGSAGGGQGSGSRVHPGKKMAGNMGGELHTVQNLKVMRVDDENGIVVVSGAVPGPKKGVVKIRDAKLKPWPEVDLQFAAPSVEPMREAEDAAQAAQTS